VLSNSPDAGAGVVLKAAVQLDAAVDADSFGVALDAAPTTPGSRGTIAAALRKARDAVTRARRACLEAPAAMEYPLLVYLPSPIRVYAHQEIDSSARGSRRRRPQVCYVVIVYTRMRSLYVSAI
jgi:hypothetical protein